ncbi:S41 family peptidase [Brevundimonas sp. NIBR11]|uniref:S41 family peptidase n=1 Tax=Brevundimonas sp. NIBR11 TaxID=3015999 RepID=UPI0022F09F60|nr:S41 family peptidase [Brevundimonas sp. NIBR11]WGM30283.1 putative CtpA-like serine protease [Brevundimonas sp. NIBR11]
MVLPARRAFLSIIAGAVLLTGTAFASAPAVAQTVQAAAPAPSRDRARMNARVFDTVWSLVRRQYYDPALHGLDWNAARQTYRPQALAALDDRALYRTLSTMLDQLDDEHAGAISPAMARRQDELRTRRAVMGVSLARQDGDVWRIESVRSGSPAEEAGLQPGWLLQTVDGQSWGVDFDVREGHPIQLDLTDEAGSAHRVMVTPRLMDPIPAFSADRSRPGVLVLRVEAFESGLGRWLGQSLADLPPETDVILDLRGNPGGLLMEADAALSCFLPGDRQWATRVSRNGRPAALTILAGCGALGGPVTNDVALLVDGSSRSAAELTPAALQEAGRALVIGEHTAGAVLISQDTPLPDGGRITLSRADYLTAGGVRLEKRGVEPDIVVTRTAEDRRAGRDPALDAAIAVLALDPEAQRAAARGSAF